jgi:uncharacterized membrane protein YphA (DoxX/SURF4 family)
LTSNTRQWGTLDTVTILGYPAYFLTIIGIRKIAGGMALLVPRFPLVKEWAYAGIVFNITGAFVSHAAVGDYGAGAYHLITTGLIALLAIASYVLRRGSWRLAVQSTSGAQHHARWQTSPTSACARAAPGSSSSNEARRRQPSSSLCGRVR